MSLLKFLITCLLLFICVTAAGQAKMKIKDAKKSFGFVKKGGIVRLEYEITNAGNAPLIISGTEISCSCTTAEYPKQPIAPGQSAKVIINFDTKTVYDRQDRIIELISNDSGSPHKLRYKGVVLAK
ncbi:MAG: hypothetical protein JWO32_654 [Bacteroidetes bacterium]|nr:hypothetical protein [Bacteroidota bacterium]